MSGPHLASRPNLLPPTERGARGRPLWLSRWAGALRLTALAGALLFGCFGPAAPSALARIARQTLTVPAVGSGGTVQPGGTRQTGDTSSTNEIPRLKVSLSAARYSVAHGKRLRLPFVLSGPAKLTLTVLRGNKVVARLSANRRRAGHGSLTWNTRIGRTLAPRGTYKLMARVVSPDGSARDSASVRIT